MGGARAQLVVMPTASARDVVYTWMNALNAGRIEEVLGLYAEDAVLLPTFSPHTLHTAAGRRGYFEQLVGRPGFSVSLHERTLRVQGLGAGVEVASGIYRFHVEIDGEPLVFEARFSFLVELGAPHPVRHHHSSQIPRTLS
jgi:hypothetical protein